MQAQQSVSQSNSREQSREQINRYEQQSSQISGLLQVQERQTQEIMRLRKTIEEQAKQLVENAERLESLNNQVKQKVNTMNNKQETYTYRIDELSYKRAQLETQLEKALYDQVQIKASYEKELLIQKQLVKQLQAQEKDQKVLSDQLQAQFLVSQQNQHVEFARQIDKAMSKITDQDAALTRTQAERVQLLEKIHELEVKNEFLTNQQRLLNREHDQKVTSIEKQLSKLSELINELEHQSPVSQTQSVTHTSGNLKKLIQLQQQEQAELKVKLLHKEQMIDDLMRGRQTLEKNAAELECRVALLNKQLISKGDKTVEELQSLVCHLQTQIKTLTQQNEELSSYKMKTNTLIREQNEQISLEKTSIQKKISEIPKEFENMKKLCETQTRTIKALKKQLFHVQLLHSDDVNQEALFIQREAEEMRRPGLMHPMTIAKKWGK
ncbi:Hypothetical_protein [Hexamita inflata]|uniref:Hypothetical_protein n=1 Tax=Hexamita inflata TaxID=28002 RepID=A0AA86RUT8_9EUKA|nr:Hypothetical protein HINF_LOCUS65919 [Hexamita inflata]